MRVVLDANVLISGVLAQTRPGTTLGRLVLALEALEFRLVTSQPILDEVQRNLSRVLAPTDVSEFAIKQYLEFLRVAAELVEVSSVIVGVATHHDDDWILATAVSGEAEILVTGDKQLLALNQYRGVTIVTPRQFLDLLFD